MRTDKKSSQRSEKKAAPRGHRQGVVGYSKKSALLEDAITQMNAGKYGRSSAALKELLALDPLNMEARRLFATLHLRLGSLIPARQAFESLVNEAFERQDYWLAESLLREYLAAGPRCVPFLDKLGTIYQDKGDTLAAVTEYGKAIDILIEDPDQDHPQLASQLYAKVRELAPASAVAFRLAAFFDAQSGELIVRAEPAQPESADGATAGSVPAHDAQESSPEVPCADEPRLVSGAAASSEQPIESLTAIADSFASSPVGEAVAEYPVEPVVAEQSPAEIGGPNLAASDVSADSSLEGSVHSHTGSTLAGSAVGQPAAERSMTGPSTVPSLSDPSPAPPKISFVERPSTETPEAGHHELRLADAAPSGYDRRSPGKAQQANPDPLSAPMPWERVEDSAITIPEREIETSPLNATTAESAPDSARPVTAPSAGPGSIEARSPADDSTGKMGDPSSSGSVQALSGLVSENQKKEGFSWESVFARAWNFSGAPSSLGQKEATPNVEIAPARNSETTAIPAVGHHQAPIQPDLSLRTAAEPGSPLSSESAAAPMPWDQVQDATIKIIAPNEVESPVPAMAGEEAGSTPGTVESGSSDLQTTNPETAQPGISPACVPADRDSGTLSTSTAVSPDDSREATFHLVDDMPVLVQDEPAANPVDVEPAIESSASESVPTPAIDLGGSTGVYDKPETELQPPVSVFATSASVPPLEQPIESLEPPVDHLSPPPVPESVYEAPPHQEENLATSASEEPVPAASTQEQPLAPEQPVHWKTGEVAVQTHRPAPKKRKRSPVSESESVGVAPSVEDQTQAEPAPALHQEPSVVEPTVQSDAPTQEPEAWASVGDSIRFVDPSVATVERPTAPTSSWEDSSPVQPVAAAVSAVDVLFDSTQRTGRVQAQERVLPRRTFRLGAAFNRIRISIFVFLRSCFSTTRAIVTTVAALAVLSAAMLVLVIGAVGMAWLAMEEKPAPAYQSLTTVPQRLLADSKNNGYLLLLGFEAPPSVDPVQTGYERKPDGKDAELTTGCTSGRGSGDNTTSADPAKSLFGVSDPAAQFRRNQDLVKALASQSEAALGRYRQWLKMRFEDWGYGQSVSPPCAAILSAHRLFVADGFTQNQLDSGIDRLEADMEAWRATLSQARTLPVKTMALQAINDDIAVASGLLVRPEADGLAADRLAKMLRPLDQMELSLRWPMQSQFVVATKTLEARLKADRAGPMPLHVRIASALPLPKQRRFNDYARYYEASYKAAGEGRFGSLPKRTYYVRSPASSLMDVLRNPLENLIGLEPLAEWEFYSGLVVDTDARLRLASLQVWLCRAPPGANLMAQIAKAGQSLYDPYTGYPMLANLGKGVIYSVGHDGRDQDAHPQADVVAAIPPGIRLTARVAPGSPGPR